VDDVEDSWDRTIARSSGPRNKTLKVKAKTRRAGSMKVPFRFASEDRPGLGAQTASQRLGRREGLRVLPDVHDEV
jgi:hypothetical protein